MIHELTEEQMDKAYEYMKMWYDSEYFTDFQIYYNSGDIEVIAYELVDSGAIDSSMCFEWAKKIEKVVEQLAENFRALPHALQASRRDKAFKQNGPVHICECQDCHFVQFLNEGNEEIYGDQLDHCWSCDSKNVENYKHGKYKTKLKFNGKKWVRK